MDYLKQLNDLIAQIPILGKLVGLIIFLYGINEIIKKVTLDNVNPLKSVWQRVYIFKAIRLRQRRRHYHDVITSVEYLNWTDNLLSKIYSDYTFIKVLGYSYQTVCFKAKVFYKYPFVELLEINKLETSSIDYPINNKDCREYKQLLGDTIKRPKLKGYMLSSLTCTDSDEITSLSAYVSTYEQNVYTSHILEYELYKLYKKKADIFTMPREKILAKLPLRNKIHGNQSQRDILTKGKNRCSLLTVQMLILFKDHEDNKYKTLVIKRSEDVSAKRGYYQFIPAGGFEIWQNEDNDFILRNNFSIRLAMFRELVEEVFGEDDFIHNEKGLPESNILKHPMITLLTDLIEKQEAFFEFLGSAIDLVALRHDLSFILRIDNLEFSKLTFLPNHESKNIQLYTVEQLNSLPKEKINQTSAGLLSLAMENELFTAVCNT